MVNFASPQVLGLIPISDFLKFYKIAFHVLNKKKPPKSNDFEGLLTNVGDEGFEPPTPSV